MKRNTTPEQDSAALARIQRRTMMKEALAKAEDLRRVQIDNIILRAFEQGLLYVPPTRFKIDANHVCLGCGAQDYHEGDCRPPVGLRRLSVKEIIARNAGTNAEASAVEEVKA